MTWQTHVTIGTNAIWLTAIAGKVDESILIFLPFAALASLLPDIEASSAKIHYVGGGFLGLFRKSFKSKYFEHRGITHSIFATAVIYFALLIFFGNRLPLLAPIFALSFFSHALLDGLNDGVGYLYPFYLKKFTPVPKMFRSKVKGPLDRLLFVIGAFGILLFFFVYAYQFQPTNFIN